MKKLLSVILAALLILSVPIAASAEIDLSGLSWEELIALKAQIDMEMFSRDQWQEVEVPQGVYKVGEDIPAGKWTITCKVGATCLISWGDSLIESENDIEFGGDISEVECVRNPESKFYKPGDRTSLDITLKEGWYVVIETSPATFTPFTGKPSLGFK